MSDFRERIKEAADSIGGLNKLAEMIGIPRRTLGDQLAEKTEPKMSLVTGTSEVTGYSIAWLATGSGARRLGETNSHSGITSLGKDASPDYISIPFLNIKAAAGEGLIPVDEHERRSPIIFSREFLRGLGASPEHCEIISASGDSMYPTITHGSPMVIDRSKIEIEDKCVYVFRVGDGIKVKRAFWRVDNGLDLVSDNQAGGYPMESYALDEASNITALARVIFVMHKV